MVLAAADGLAAVGARAGRVLEVDVGVGDVGDSEGYIVIFVIFLGGSGDRGILGRESQADRRNRRIRTQIQHAGTKGLRGV